MRSHLVLGAVGVLFLIGSALAVTGGRGISQQGSYLPNGTGASLTTLENGMRMRGVHVKEFGAVGDSTTDDTAAIQKALDYVFKLASDTGVQGRVWLDHGGYKITAPLIIGKDTDLIGEGADFGTSIVVAASFSGAAALIIDGDLATGGFDFRQTLRDFMIDCTATSKAILPITIKVHKAYNIAFEHVWIFNGYGTGWDIDFPQDVTLLGARAWGVTANAGTSEYGIRIHDSTGATLGAHATIIDPDIESYFKGISVEDDAQVTIAHPYMERNIRGWQAIGNSNGSLTVYGGHIVTPGASGISAFIAAPNVTVQGGSYIANGGAGLTVDTGQRYANVKITNVTPVADVSDVRNYSSWDRVDSTNWYPAKVRNYKAGVSSGVATTFYTITLPFNANYYAIGDLTVNARDASGYSVWTGKYRFVATNADATVRATAVTEYAKAAQNFSGNFTIAVVVAATVSGSTVLVQVTATTGGALGTGVNPNVSTELDFSQWDSAGGVYVTAN